MLNLVYGYSTDIVSKFQFDFLPSLFLTLFITVVHSFCHCTKSVKFKTVSGQVSALGETVDDVILYVGHISYLHALKCVKIFCWLLEYTLPKFP